MRILLVKLTLLDKEGHYPVLEMKPNDGKRALAIVAESCPVHRRAHPEKFLASLATAPVVIIDESNPTEPAAAEWFKDTTGVGIRPYSQPDPFPFNGEFFWQAIRGGAYAGRALGWETFKLWITFQEKAGAPWDKGVYYSTIEQVPLKDGKPDFSGLNLPPGVDIQTVRVNEHGDEIKPVRVGEA